MENDKYLIVIFCVVIIGLLICYLLKKNRNNFKNIVNKPELQHPFEEKDQEVIPNNPYYTSNMVVMNKPNLKYEKVKNNYLVKKNMEYMKIDDDELNKNLLPQGTMFAHP